MDRFERVINVMLAVAAIAIAATFAHREFAVNSESATAAAAGTTPPTFLKDWRSLLTTGIEIGDTTAKVKVIEFADMGISVVARQTRSSSCAGSGDHRSISAVRFAICLRHTATRLV